MKPVKSPLPMIVSGLLISAVAVSGASQKGADKTTNNVLIATAQITRIDAKKQIFKVRNVAASQNDGGAASAGGARQSAGAAVPGAGRGGRSGGAGGRMTGAAAPSTPSSDQMGPEYTLYIVNATVLKDGDREIHFEDFKVGDRINITGTAKKGGGSDMNATVISRAQPN